MGALLDEVRAARKLPEPARRRELRRDAGISRRRLAAELGVAEATITRWETGARHPRGDLLLRYAEIIDALETGS